MNYQGNSGGYRTGNQMGNNQMNSQMHYQMNTSNMNTSMHHMNSHHMNPNSNPMNQGGMQSGPGPIKGTGGSYPVVSGGQARTRPYHIPGSNVTPQQYPGPRRGGHNPTSYGHMQQGQQVSHSQANQTYPGNQVIDKDLLNRNR